MPEAGGPTTQSGIIYQNSIAALYLGRLLDATPRPENERVVHLRVETTDKVDDIVVTFADNHKTYLQAKEDVHIGDDAWKKLWSDFENQFLSTNFILGIDRLALWVGNFRDEHTQLRELCNRAISSNSIEDWETRLTEKQKEILEKIKKHLYSVRFIDSIILNFFKHIEVEIHPLKTIERDEIVFWMPDSNSFPISLFRMLRDKVGGTARIRGEFTVQPLLNSLKHENPALVFSKPQDIEEIKQLIRASSSLLRQQKNTIGNTGIHISRSIVNEIVNWIIDSSDETKNLAMLIDQAGTGKTIVMHDVQVCLESNGYDVLAIKTDLQLSGIVHVRDFGDRLGFDQSLEQTLSRLSGLGRVAVLIDQIDALSLSLAHDQHTLDIVLDFIARLRQVPNLRILISCRLFDRNSDYRIKQIDTTQTFSLTQFTDDEVSQVLDTMGVAFKDLHYTTRSLLQTPLHLNLFVLALESNASRETLFSVASLQELFGAIWENLVLRDEAAAPSKTDRVEVLRVLTQYMFEHQLVSVPRSVLLRPDMTHLERATNWLASTGVIVAGKNDWTYIHQTFFDYCYAREFVEQGDDLVDEILRSDQGLFIRPQIIQVITYMRGTNTSQYLRDLATLLSIKDLRFHLYDLLLRWFGSLPNPTDDEWTIARRMLIDERKRIPTLQRMYGNPDWFSRLQNNYIADWLSENNTDETMLQYLVSIADQEGSQLSVIRFLQSFLGKSKQWDAQLLRIVAQIRSWHSVQAVEFYEHVIYRTQQLDGMYLYQIGLVAKEFPSSGVRLLRFLLDCILYRGHEKLSDSQIDKDDPEDPKSFVPSLYSELHALENNGLEEAFDIVSRSEPRQYIEVMIPWLDQVLTRRGAPKENSPTHYAWDDLSGNWYNDRSTIEHEFVFGLIKALICIAKSDPSYFDSIADLLSHSPFRTPQLLLAIVFKFIPDTHATKALQFILGDRRRLELGDVDDYDSRSLVQAIIPFLSIQERSELEEFILQPPLIRKRFGLDGLRYRGIEQLHMLQSIPKEYLSKRALQQLSEWEHKFPGSKPVDDPATAKGGFVVSPIPTEIAQKMTDQQWERAINKYQGAYEPREFLKGGALELSRVLDSLVKEDPNRYFSLLQRINDDVDDAYVQAFINGFAESTASIEYLIDTIRRFSQQPGRNIRRTIAWALEKRKKEKIPEDLTKLLLGYFFSDPGEDEEWWSKGENHGDVFSSFLNSDRGASFHTLMRIFDEQNDDEASRKKWELIKFITSDPSAALRIGAIYELIYMLEPDRARAINVFKELLVDHAILLESNHTRDFLYWAFFENYLRLHQYIVAMMEYPKEQVQEQGAQLACITALAETSMESQEALRVAQELAEQTTTSTASLSWKRGAAVIYANNIAGDRKDICVLKISQLLKEDDEQIHDTISRVFHSLKEEHIFSLRDFIVTYTKLSKKFNHMFSEYLLNYGLVDPEWTLSVVQEFLKNKEVSLQPTWTIGFEDITRLVIKIYTDPTVRASERNTAMDLFDILMEKSPGSSQKVLSEWDQR